MCDQEGVQTLQRGMNFRLNSRYSVVLMSQRTNAPYNDFISEDGLTLEYEGHDEKRNAKKLVNPKSIDQPERTSTGTLTQNGHFMNAAIRFKTGGESPEIVRVYEKIFPGIWSEKGFFELIDYKYVLENGRKVFKFILREAEFEIDDLRQESTQVIRTRLIPTKVKKVVWQRDGGKCVLCGSSENLHFDHDLPFSKGGTSVDPKNVKILCAKHNLSKSNKIE